MSKVVAKKPDVGVASKFSVLRIDDDSSDEEGLGGLLANSKKTGTKSGPAAQQQPKKSGATKKRGKKKPKVLPAWNNGDQQQEWEERDIKFVDKQFDDDVEKALEASRVETENQERLAAVEEANLKAALVASEKVQPGSSAKVKNADKAAIGNGAKSASSHGARDAQSEGMTAKVGHSPPTNTNCDFFKELEEETKRIREAESKKRPFVTENLGTGDALVLKLYLSKLEEASEQLSRVNSENQFLKEEVKKYKERYKKLCQLLKDSEVKEKVQLVVDMERSAEVREELTAQIEDLNGQLEQARSKIHQLEDAQKSGAHGGK